MKIAVIANQGGSGGLMAYLNGILSVRTEHTVNGTARMRLSFRTAPRMLI